MTEWQLKQLYTSKWDTDHSISKHIAKPVLEHLIFFSDGVLVLQHTTKRRLTTADA